MKTKTNFILIPLLILLVFGGIPVNGEVFTGVGDKTTATFTSDLWTKIEWSGEASNSFDLFSTFIYPQGETVYEDNFDGLSGITYLYESGVFYFDVITANLDSWTITTTQSTGDWLEDEEVVRGVGNVNTQLFDCSGNCQIAWNTSAANDFDLFSVFIYDVNSNGVYTSFFDGASGTTNLYESGTFYLTVIAANLNQWAIKVFLDNPPTQTSDDTTTILITTSDLTSSKIIIDDPVEEEENNPISIIIGIGIIVAIIVWWRRRK